MTPEDELRVLRARVGEMEQVLASLASRSPEPAEDEARGRAIRDTMWKCRKCASLLAFYDEQADTLRIRYKEHLVYVQLGSSGWIQIVCRSCGEPNEQRYATSEEVATTRGQTARGVPPVLDAIRETVADPGARRLGARTSGGHRD